MSQDQDIPYGYCECGCGGKTTIARFDDRAYGSIQGEPRRFIHGHSPVKNPGPKYIAEDCGFATPCLVWRRSIAPNGYGTRTRRGERKESPHRWAYEDAYGPIPDGLHIDHLCGNRACVNPSHLEAVTLTENLRRGKGTKLTVESVAQIKRRLADERLVDLASEFGVAIQTISSIKRGDNWRDVAPETVGRT